MSFAARLGDMTAHGGTILLGFPTVLIGGKPAARVSDMHVCPMVTGVVPHVGGPVLPPGSPTVLIGGLPAARVGDMATCVGPPDIIIPPGCPTVLIGMAGAGGAGGGAGGGGGGAGARASASTALVDNKESSTKEEHWVEFEFADKAGLPVSGVDYRFKDATGKESEATLRLDGTVRRDGLVKEGQCEVVLMYVSNAKWEKDKTEVGEKVNMNAMVEGYDRGTAALFQVFKRDLRGPDVVVAEFRPKTQSDKVEAKWAYEPPEDTDNVLAEDHIPDGYSAPVYFFEVNVGRSKARSGILEIVDYLEVELKDEEGTVLANEDYVMYLSNGEVRKGKLDGNGKTKIEQLSPGFFSVRFPNR